MMFFSATDLALFALTEPMVSCKTQINKLYPFSITSTLNI